MGVLLFKKPWLFLLSQLYIHTILFYKLITGVIYFFVLYEKGDLLQGGGLFFLCFMKKVIYYKGGLFFFVLYEKGDKNFIHVTATPFLIYWGRGGQNSIGYVDK